MSASKAGTVARVARTPRLFWQVTAYRASGAYVAGRVCGSLTAAYRFREELLGQGVSVVVVEVV